MCYILIEVDTRKHFFGKANFPHDDNNIFK